MPRKYFVVGVILVVISLVGILWNEFFLDHAKEQPRSGGIYTEATLGEIQNLNPLSPTSSSFDRDLQALLFAGLLRYDPVKAKVVDGLAELQLLDQGKVYQLKIKPESRFSDGDTVDVADVLFTYETLIQNPKFKNSALRASFEYIDISVVDDRTVSFRLPEQNVFFPYLLTTPILPKKHFKNRLLEEILDPDLPFNRRPIGAGPYRLNNIVPEDDGLIRVFLERSPYYYQGKAYIEEIVFYVYSDSDRLQLNDQWPNVFSRIPYREVDQFLEGLFGEYDDYEFYQPRFVGLFFNLDQPIVGNVNFRRGLKRILDLERFLEPGWEPIDSPFFFENIEGDWPGADSSGARDFLRDNGFPYNEQLEARTFERQGPPVRIKMVTTTQPPVYSRMAQNIKNTWEEELDIEVELLVLTPDELQIALRDRLYDVLLFGQDFSRNLDNLSVWHSSQTDKLNLSNVTRDDIDFHIEEIRFSGSRDDYIALQDRMDVIVPAIMIATPNQKLLTSKNLKNFEETWGRIRHLSDRFTHVNDWHFETRYDWDWPDGKSKIVGFIKWLFSAKKDKVEVPEVIEKKINLNPEAVPADIVVPEAVIEGEEPGAETEEDDNTSEVEDEADDVSSSESEDEEN